MNPANKTSKILGGAFLFQAITSLTSGLVLNHLIVPQNISRSMINIANNAWLMRAGIFVDLLTAMGIIFLGAILFIFLRKQNEKAALVALGCYILEASLIAVSRMAAFILLRVSQEYATAGHSAYLLTIGNLTSEAQHFVGMTLSMLTFCIGAMLFYYLLDKSRIVPRWLSLWGLITVFPCFIGTLLSIFGFKVPFAVFLPYAPFEFVIGVWILAKGVRELAEASDKLSSKKSSGAIRTQPR